VPLTIGIASLGLVMLTGLTACCWCWLILAARTALTLGWISGSAAAGLEDALKSGLRVEPRLPIIPWSPRRPVPWAILDLAVLLVIWLVLQLVLLAIAHAANWPLGQGLEKFTLHQRQIFMAVQIGLSLVILAVGLPLIALRTGATPHDFGWSPRDFAADLRTGLAGLVMLAPPVYALQAVLVYFWQPSKHPLIEMFKGTPDTGFFVLLFITAAIVAPVFEELIFRVILQGFLERVFSHHGPLHELIWDRPKPPPEPVAATALAEPLQALAGLPSLSEAWDKPTEAQLNPYAAPQQVTQAPPKPTTDDFEQPELPWPLAWCAIGISSTIFALLHFGHGPDWVPLLPLAIGMGYLYQRTHRLLPSLVVHFGLNSLSMWMLWIYIDKG
jgi:membrane protease YdiL (CAAX protease family)